MRFIAKLNYGDMSKGRSMGGTLNFKDRLFRLVTGLHEAVFRSSGGRVLRRAGGMPVLILHTTGRRSGKSRSTVLTAPVVDGERIVVVASYGGDDRHPAWFLNLRDRPDVEVTMDGERRAMHARVATAEERSQLWPRIVAGYKGYAGYQRRTDREIPVVILQRKRLPNDGRRTTPK